MDGDRVERISREAFALLDTARQVAPFSERYDGFDLAQAYAVVARVKELREGRGERAVGRKIGFTNRAAWRSLGISAPVWNYVFDRTVTDASAGQATFDLRTMPEPRIEPEIVFHLARDPTPEMSETELFACLDWFAAGYEIVYSIFPAWRFTAADAAAAYGVHGSLLVGGKRPITGAGAKPSAELASFSVEMKSDRGNRCTGSAVDVLGGPLQALRYLVAEIARFPSAEPLRAGELVTTGTLTEAKPAVTGESWTTSFAGIALQPVSLRFS